MMQEPTEFSTNTAPDGIVKTVPVIRDLSLNPCCDHGPTILFERNGQRFFTCSAYRCRKLCSFYLPEEKWKVSGGGKDKQDWRCPGKEGDSKRRKVEGNKLGVNNPLSAPNQKDKGEAQYHFNEPTVNFLMDQLNNLGIDGVLSVGTPSLHEQVTKLTSEGKRRKKLKSFLLDIDQRFSKIYEDGFCLYNMCNHHFFEDSTKYLDFLTKCKKIAVIVDPPFGVKVELIWHGCLMGIQRDLSRIQGNFESRAEDIKLCFDAFWIFPYFMEGHILKCSDSKLQMSDFHVEYRNHPKYNGSTSKSKSSPIRIFTTVSLSELRLPEKDYRYCDVCSKWVDKQNLHCNLCGTCTTKDGGQTYNHCSKCKKCVKPTWKHCSKCKTCHLADSTCKSIRREESQFSSSISRKRNVNFKQRNMSKATKNNMRIKKKT